MVTKLPVIGDTITPQSGAQLCRSYELVDIARRLELHPELYDSFKFDGASCVPTWLEKCVPGMTRRSLVHDLCYAYGVKGDWDAKWDADIELAKGLKQDIQEALDSDELDKINALVLRRAGGAYGLAKIVLATVVVAGDVDGSGFEWGFANKLRMGLR